MTEPKEYWQVNTERLADDLREAAGRSVSEEDFKIKAETLLRRAFKSVGVNPEIVEYEKSALRSKMDAVYGYLTLEYKAPGTLSRRTEVEKAHQQLQRYLTRQAQTADPATAGDFLEKAVGVCLDGETIFFVRYAKSARWIVPPVPVAEQPDLFPELRVTKGFQLLGPYRVTAASLANLLIFARAVARRPMTAENVASVFGPEQPVACQVVSELYSALIRSQRRQVPSRIKAFFQEWDRHFGVVYGQELAKAQPSAEITAARYRLAGGAPLKQLLFSIHTYYALLMKLIALELLSLQEKKLVASVVAGMAGLDDKEMFRRFEELESGAGFADKGIVNFMEADFFRWYLDAWDDGLASALRQMVRALAEFESATPVLEPSWTVDLLQKIYERIVPRELRHDLGEFYTPSWLARHLVDLSGYDGDPRKRFLDPSCGSGTFLIQALHKVLKFSERDKKVDPKALGEKILANVVGFDINPLAVLAARTNYLIAFSRFIPFVRPISLPVYLCDSVITPDSGVEAGELSFDDSVHFVTAKGVYRFPAGFADRENVDWFTGEVETAVRAKLTPDKFAQRLQTRPSLAKPDRDLLLDVYRKIKELDDRGEDGFWARYIKNAFAPRYLEKFDFVAGNPPWIRWGYLSDDYRKRTLKLWHRYGLFSLKGHETRLGQGEKDFSMLFTYACADNYLKDKGVLAFVITLEVFKSKGAGEGFRTFRLKHNGVPLGVERMEDLVRLQPFSGAANKTCVFVLRKGEPVKYPVPVVEWRRKPGVGRIPPAWSLEEVQDATRRVSLKAVPVDPNRPVSSWQTATVSEIRGSRNLKGENPYRAFRGASTEPYGVFWLNVNEVRPDKKLAVENMHDRGKREIKKVAATLEPDLVYPAVSGGDLTSFGTRGHFYVLISQNPETREGYDEDWLSAHLPLTYAYLVQFKEALIKRAAYQKYFHKDVKKRGKVVGKVATAPFYSMYNISEESLWPHRVTWKRMASRMEAAVLSKIKVPFGLKAVISTDTTSFIPVEDRREAHYLCALLNSGVVDGYIRSFSSGGRGFGAPSVVKNLAVPKFDGAKPLHKKLADLSEEAHDRVEQGKNIEDIQEEVNDSAEKLWNIKS